MKIICQKCKTVFAAKKVSPRKRSWVYMCPTCEQYQKLNELCPVCPLAFVCRMVSSTTVPKVYQCYQCQRYFVSPVEEDSYFPIGTEPGCAALNLLNIAQRGGCLCWDCAES